MTVAASNGTTGCLKIADHNAERLLDSADLGAGGMRIKTWIGFMSRVRDFGGMGLREPREILIGFSLYQRMWESTTSMNRSMVVAF